MVEVVSARRSQTREKLVEAATLAFAEKGVLGASVEEICDAAGFTRGAFYSNFDSKDALCLAVLESQAAGTLAATHTAIATLTSLDASAPPSLDGLARRAIDVFLRSQLGDRASLLALVELRLYAVREASMRASYLAHFERVTSEFVALIERTASDFGYRLALPGPQVVAVLQGVYEQGAIAGLLSGQPDEGSDRATILAGVLMSMLKTAQPDHMPR
jgi:AcrR family transcriptional regulator